MRDVRFNSETYINAVALRQFLTRFLSVLKIVSRLDNMAPFYIWER